MNYPTKIDPVVFDEAAYDRQCEANQVRMERCRNAAQNDFEAGDLDKQVIEWLIDENPEDMAKLALAVLDGIDRSDLDLYISRQSISINSIRSTIDAVIEDHASTLYDSGENY